MDFVSWISAPFREIIQNLIVTCHLTRAARARISRVIGVCTASRVFLIREFLAQQCDPHARVRSIRSGELAMEENSLPEGESPNGIPVPDAALDGPGRSGRAFVYVSFLPSPFGPGYEAGIRGWVGNYDPADGWADSSYYRLAGVARLPDPVSRLDCPQWHKTVIDRLRRNGVVFLDEVSAEAYMKTEGQYWLHWFFGDAPLLRRLLWSIVKPKTPISDEAERLAQAVTLIREHAGLPSVARYCDYRRIKGRKAMFSAGAESC